MTPISKIYALTKMLDNLEMRVFEYEIAKNMEDDAYSNLWLDEKLKRLYDQIEFIKSELKYIISLL